MTWTRPWRWAAASNARAVANARAAAVECSRRRLERAEVAAYVEVSVEGRLRRRA
ncbi:MULTISPECIES: hypothetical protein [unclassified Nocardioides]|uniref:hypothetical protein n=1 Tax=unclassified Nocardioides TaxID=2615069 RepID=UPI002665303E|nr:hypothetical protein [Nocardioides sp. Arc9.136]WKN50130.1 hypothetical protein OSR43_08395 [Nocardioides sp. Arc9.136]